jgi:hypothetical protein
MGQTSDPETLVIHQKLTPGNNPKTFKQHYDHGGSLQLHTMVLFVLILLVPLPILACIVITWKLLESKSGTNEFSTCKDKLVQTFISNKLQTAPGLYAVLSLHTVPFNVCCEMHLTKTYRH